VAGILSTVFLLISIYFLPYPPALAVLIAVTVIFLRRSRLKIVAIIILVILFIIQITSTNLSAVFQFSGLEISLHQSQLDAYPPPLARLANIVENKIETLIFVRLRQNLFDGLDLSDIFSHYQPIILFLPFIYHFFRFLLHPDKTVVMLFMFSLVVCTFIGVHGQCGPLLLLPFYLYFITNFDL